MNDAIMRFVGKDCLIYCGAGFGENVSGVIEDIAGDWITVKTKGGIETVRIDYVTRIREYPKSKNGRRRGETPD